MRYSKTRLVGRRALTTIAAFLLALAIPVPACKALVEGQGHQCAVDTTSGDHLCCARLGAEAAQPGAPALEDVADCSTVLRVLDPAAIVETAHSDIIVASDAVRRDVSPGPTTDVVFAVPTQERAGPAPPLFLLHSSFLI
jgi:hypothetical protein